MGQLTSEIELEVAWEEDVVWLMDALRDLIAAKETEIANEKKLAEEMIDVRSKLMKGSVAMNLDKLAEKKLNAASIEEELVRHLVECQIDLQNLLEDAHDCASRTARALEGFQRPATQSSTPYEWGSIDEMEVALQQAADNVAAAEERIRELSLRIDSVLVSKAAVLGEDMPAGLAKTAERAAARNKQSTRKVMDVADVAVEIDVEGFLDLKEKDETELLVMLAKSAASATVDGSMAAVYGLKALLDTVSSQMGENDVDDKISGAIVKSSDSKKNDVTSVIEAVGKAGSTLVRGIGQSESAQVAGEALKKTTKDLYSSMEAAAALSAKLYDTTLKRIENIDRTGMGKQKNLKRISEARGTERYYPERPAESETFDVEEIQMDGPEESQYDINKEWERRSRGGI